MRAIPPGARTLAVLLLAALAGQAAPRPNIILAMADDMGWGDPGYSNRTITLPDGSPHPDRGWIHTPTLDAMAANGLRFDRFYSASAVCSPTRASCLTGRNPFRVGVPGANTGRLGFDESPLSEVLAAAGYRCGHFGKWHLGTMTTVRADSNRGGNAAVYSAPWHHGYHTCFSTEAKVPTHHPYRKADNTRALPAAFGDPNFYGTYYWRMPATWNRSSGEGEIVPVAEVNNPADGDDSKLLVDQALPFMQEAVSRGEPFFVVLWFHTPHKPVVDPDGTSAVDSSDAAKDSIEDLDAALGRVRSALDTLGVRDNTMFWFTSDNGPENGVNSPNESSTLRSIRSGRFLERKRSLHEGGVRVPGILEWPDVIPTGRVTGVPAVTSDYYPTILDYLCLAVPGQKPLDGISLRPVIEGSAAARERPIGFRIGNDRSWVDQEYKLIDDGSGWELYELVNLPAGQEVEEVPLATATNLSSQPRAVQDRFNRMLSEFTTWNASVDGDTPYLHPAQPTARLGTVSNQVSAPFVVRAAFSEPVQQLHAGEFAVTNGSATGLLGGGDSWSVTITPLTNGEVTVHLPEGAVIDAAGNPNAASNLLRVTHLNPSAPDCTLSTPDDPVDGSFFVTATFSETVTGLAAQSFTVTNGTPTHLQGGPVSYTVSITPVAPGPVSITLPAGAAEDLDGVPSNRSNTLLVSYDPPGREVRALRHVLPLAAGQTVDSADHVPANHSNNLAKFTVGSVNDGVANPFTTTLYTRSSSGAEATERRSRAFVRFDLSSLNGLPVSTASLSFVGHSLNDQNPLALEVLPLAVDWSVAGGPPPTFQHPAAGPPLTAGDIVTNLTPEHTRDYQVDLTTLVRDWTLGALPNHGLQIRLDRLDANNGVGIKLSGEGAIHLLVEELPVVIRQLVRGPTGDDITIEWSSVAGAEYQVQAGPDLEGPWETVQVVTGGPGPSSTFVHVGGMAGLTSRFYRVAYPGP